MISRREIERLLPGGLPYGWPLRFGLGRISMSRVGTPTLFASFIYFSIVEEMKNHGWFVMCQLHQGNFVLAIQRGNFSSTLDKFSYVVFKKNSIEYELHFSLKASSNANNVPVELDIFIVESVVGRSCRNRRSHVDHRQVKACFEIKYYKHDVDVSTALGFVGRARVVQIPGAYAGFVSAGDITPAALNLLSSSNLGIAAFRKVDETSAPMMSQAIIASLHTKLPWLFRSDYSTKYTLLALFVLLFVLLVVRLLVLEALPIQFVRPDYRNPP